MVLGPFAETKGLRRAGAKPRENLSPPPVILDLIQDPVSFLFPSYTPQKPTLDSCFRRNDSRSNRGSSVFAVSFFCLRTRR